MKSFLVLTSFLFAASSSFATSPAKTSGQPSAGHAVQLSDTVILGEYGLVKPTSKTGLNLAQVRISSENKLVVTNDFN